MTLTTKEVLLKIVQGEDGREWANDESREGWTRSSSLDVCSWYGITCNDEQSSITQINLADTALIASIPKEFGNLKELTHIDLSMNVILSTIPPEFASLPNLIKVNLSENSISGPIPLFASNQLTSLNMGYNLLVGTIPKEIGNQHPKMTDLDLMHNQLRGYLPSSLSKLNQLKGLSLSSNNLSGTIPFRLFQDLTLLRFLYLDQNAFVGFLPFQFSSPLEELWLQDNLFSGTISNEIEALSNLVNFYIDGNKVTGSIPHKLCRENLNKDFYQHISNNVQRDYCDSVACPKDTWSIKGVFPCFACEESYKDLVGGKSVPGLASTDNIHDFFNPYLGKTGKACFNINQRTILEKFFHDTGGTMTWKSYDNWDIEDSFLCDFYGITCNPNNQVISVDLKNNGLKGTITSELGFLKYLEKLDISDNELTGVLPSDLRFTSLTELDISGNQIRGIVPPKLCELQVNQNGKDGIFDCNNVACPPGTYNANFGRKVGEEDCLPCSTTVVEGDVSTHFLASKLCINTALKNKEAHIDSNNNHHVNSPAEETDTDVKIGIIIFFFAMASSVLLLLYKTMRSSRMDMKRKYPIERARERGRARTRQQITASEQSVTSQNNLLEEENRHINIQVRRSSQVGNSNDNSFSNSQHDTASLIMDASNGTRSNNSSTYKKKPTKIQSEKLKIAYNTKSVQKSTSTTARATSSFEFHGKEPSVASAQEDSIAISSGSGSSSSGGIGGSEGKVQSQVWLDVPKLA